MTAQSNLKLLKISSLWYIIYLQSVSKPTWLQWKPALVRTFLQRFLRTILDSVQLSTLDHAFMPVIIKRSLIIFPLFHSMIYPFPCAILNKESTKTEIRTMASFLGLNYLSCFPIMVSFHL